MPSPFLLLLALQGDAHMTGMDAFFACMFTQVRAERAAGSSLEEGRTALAQACLGEEAELQRLSADLLVNKGRSKEEAVVEAASLLAAARLQVMAIYAPADPPPATGSKPAPSSPD